VRGRGKLTLAPKKKKYNDGSLTAMAGYSADLLENLADKKKREIRFQVPNTIFV